MERGNWGGIETGKGQIGEGKGKLRERGAKNPGARGMPASQPDRRPAGRTARGPAVAEARWRGAGGGGGQSLALRPEIPAEAPAECVCVCVSWW